MAEDKDKGAKEEKEQAYLQYQMLVQQLQQIQQYAQHIETQLQELIQTQTALEELGKSKKESEILAPISGGIFVKARLTDNKNVRVNVGAQTIVEKDVDGTVKLIDAQKKELEKAQAQINADLMKANLQLQILQNKLKD